MKIFGLRASQPSLVQEQPGFHLGISIDLRAASRHAAAIARDKYQA